MIIFALKIKSILAYLEANIGISIRAKTYSWRGPNSFHPSAGFSRSQKPDNIRQDYRSQEQEQQKEKESILTEEHEEQLYC